MKWSKRALKASVYISSLLLWLTPLTYSCTHFRQTPFTSHFIQDIVIQMSLIHTFQVVQVLLGIFSVRNLELLKYSVLKALPLLCLQSNSLLCHKGSVTSLSWRQFHCFVLRAVPVLCLKGSSTAINPFVKSLSVHWPVVLLIQLCGQLVHTVL